MFRNLQRFCLSIFLSHPFFCPDRFHFGGTLGRIFLCHSHHVTVFYLTFYPPDVVHLLLLLVFFILMDSSEVLEEFVSNNFTFVLSFTSRFRIMAMFVFTLCSICWKVLFFAIFRLDTFLLMCTPNWTQHNVYVFHVLLAIVTLAMYVQLQ